MQKLLDTKDWRTRKDVNGDYLLWVDANPSLKLTMWLIEIWIIQPCREMEDLATAEWHIITMASLTGVFRVIAFTRVYAPMVPSLSAPAALRNVSNGRAGGWSRRELGKKWFGGFIAIEPGQGRLSFSYLLPNTIHRTNQNGSAHYLFRRVGLPEMGLTPWAGFW